MRAYQNPRRHWSSRRGHDDANVGGYYEYEGEEEDGGNYHGYSSSSSYPSSLQGYYGGNYSSDRQIQRRAKEEPSLLEMYVRNRFKKMAEEIHDERHQIRRLLRDYENRKVTEYEEMAILRRGRERPEMQETSPRFQPQYERYETTSEETDDANKVDSASHNILQSTTTQGMPRYQAHTASSRRRLIETTLEQKAKSDQDIPAHQEVFPVPLHVAARLGLPGVDLGLGYA